MGNSLAIFSWEKEKVKEIPNSFLDYLNNLFWIDKDLIQTYWIGKKSNLSNLSIDEIIEIITCIEKWWVVNFNELIETFVEYYHRHCNLIEKHRERKLSKEDYIEYKTNTILHIQYLLTNYIKEISYRTDMIVISLQVMNRHSQHGWNTNITNVRKISQTDIKTSEIKRKVGNISKSLLILNQNVEMIFESIEQKLNQDTFWTKVKRVVLQLLLPSTH